MSLFIKLDCLFSKKKDKYYIITKHNKKRCQALWMANHQRYGRQEIRDINMAIKYNKKAQFIEKALNVLNSDLIRENKELEEMQEEYSNSNYQYLFEDAISQLEYSIDSIKRQIKKYKEQKTNA